MQYQCNVLASTAIAIFSGVFLINYISNNKDLLDLPFHACENGFNCTELYFAGPPAPLNDEFTSMLKEMYLLPPPRDPDRTEFDIYTPVWRKLVDWVEVQKNLIEIFKDQPPGFFVEVGAVDGDFMSQTIYLEKNLNWNGLLVEPDPRSFQELIKIKRNAWLSPICVNYGYPSHKRYWLRKLEDNLPHHFTQLLMARSKLENEILEGDEERGTVISVPCTPLASVLKAIGITKIDLISINTGGEDDYAKIKDVLRGRNIQAKVALMHFTTTKLYSSPFPRIPGYIVDAKRSQLLVKFYYKMSYCKLHSSDVCENINTFSVVEACYTYICFGFLRVVSFHPDVTALGQKQQQQPVISTNTTAQKS